MAGFFSVATEIVAGIPVMTLTYGSDGMLQTGSELSVALIAEYRKTMLDSSAKSRSLIFVIDADTAGSPLIRAMVDLYKAVAGSGKLIFAGYPLDYLPGLASLGFLDMPDVEIAPTLDAALRSLRAIP